MRLIDQAPETWDFVNITEVAEVNPTHPDDSPDEDELTSFVPMKKVEELTGRLDPSTHKEWGEINSGYTRFQEGDVVIAKITPSMENGKAALAKNLKNGVAAGSTELHVIRPSERVLAEYILYFVLQEGFRREAESNMTGTAGHMRVPTEFIEDVDLPLPPIREQKLIVAKIEELFSKLESGVSELNEARQRMEHYRRSVMNDAVNGGLTQKWRAERDGKVSAGIEDEQVIHGMHEIEGELANLPEGWSWAKLGDITDNYDSEREPINKSTRADMQGPYPYYGASGVIDHLDDYILDGRFLLISEDGANLENRTKPIAFIVDGKFWPNNHAHVVQTKYGIPLEYLELYIESRSIRQYITGTAQPKLTQTNLNKIPVPVGPREELTRIVELAQRKISIVDSVNDDTADNLSRSTRLRQSILKHAFEGKVIQRGPTKEHSTHTESSRADLDSDGQMTLSEVASDAE